MATRPTLSTRLKVNPDEIESGQAKVRRNNIFAQKVAGRLCLRQFKFAQLFDYGLKLEEYLKRENRSWKWFESRTKSRLNVVCLESTYDEERLKLGQEFESLNKKRSKHTNGNKVKIEKQDWKMDERGFCTAERIKMIIIKRRRNGRKNIANERFFLRQKVRGK
jgi:hypothetical protein